MIANIFEGMIQMKQNIDTNGVLYKSVKKGRTKLSVILFLLIVMFFVHTASSMPYLEKRAFGASELDSEAFAKATKLVAINSDYKPSKEEAKIYGHAREKTSYWHGDKYYFSISDAIFADSGLAYTSSGAIVTPQTDTNADPVAVRLGFMDIGGTKTAVLLLGDAAFGTPINAEGIFVELSPLVRKDLAKYLPEGENISEYMFDVRGIDMDTEYSDTVIWFALIAIILFLVTKLLVYFLNPLKHPTYRCLDKYGDIVMIANDIETQVKLPSATFHKNRIMTDDWIINKGSFACKTEKNFTAGGSFKYTPYQK